jgi:hypothetical protein
MTRINELSTTKRSEGTPRLLRNEFADKRTHSIEKLTLIVTDFGKAIICGSLAILLNQLLSVHC